MELGRWSIGAITRVSDRYRELKDFLVEVLEGERTLLDQAPTGQPAEFQVASIASLLFQPINAARLSAEFRQELFAQLTPYFLGGFLLRPMESLPDGQTHLEVESMFVLGRQFHSVAGQSSIGFKLRLPNLSTGKVYRGRVAPLLNILHLDQLNLLKSGDAFLLSPDGQMIIVLVCGRAPLWQSEAIEKVYTALADELKVQRGSAR